MPSSQTQACSQTIFWFSIDYSKHLKQFLANSLQNLNIFSDIEISFVKNWYFFARFSKRDISWVLFLFLSLFLAFNHMIDILTKFLCDIAIKNRFFSLFLVFTEKLLSFAQKCLESVVWFENQFFKLFDKTVLQIEKYSINCVVIFENFFPKYFQFSIN